MLDHERKRVDFRVVEGLNVAGDPGEATTSRGDTVCLLCRQVVKAEYARQAGRDGKMGAMLTSVVLQAKGSEGKSYRADRLSDREAYEGAAEGLRTQEASNTADLTLVPDEPIDPSTLGLRVDAFGLDTWRELFNERQLLALATFAELVGDGHDKMVQSGLEGDYAEAVATYLALGIDRLADYGSTLSTWRAQADQEKVNHTFARQALSMVWDFAESNPFADSSGGWAFGLGWIASAIEMAALSGSTFANVRQRSAAGVPMDDLDAILTDPPYYDAIDYAGLSDFFYVWLRRSLQPRLHLGLLELPLTPKRDQAIMASEGTDRAARERYVGIMRQAFSTCGHSLGDSAVFGVVFAHSQPDAWATLIEGLLTAGLCPDASWPIDTELQNKTSAGFRANLQTSVWMACRPREIDAGEAFIGDVIEEMRASIRDRLLAFWRAGIRGADFFISAIGPALSVYGRHSRVLRPDGTEVVVRDFLDLVRREATQVALEQVLHGADLGIIDPVTRQYVTWVWGYSRAPLDAGEAIALCLATGADYGQVVRPGSIAVEAREKSKKVVKLRTIRERGRDDDNLGLDSPARPAPLIDQLQRAANLWGLNRMDELGSFRGTLGETRWVALRTLGQAVAECLPDGDEDRRLIFGLLGSNIMATGPVPGAGGARSAQQPLPGLS